MSKEKVIGIIGVGLMGGGMARNLLRKGYKVIVYDVDREKANSFLQLGAKVASSCKELVKNSDIIITSLPTPSIVREVYLGKDGVIENAKEGQVLIDTSTVDPETSSSVKKAADIKRVKMLAVTLGKGPKQAEEGSMPLFVGGDKEVYEEVKDFLKDLGGVSYYMGTVEASTSFKLISNMIGLGNLALLAEGYALSRKFGIPPEIFIKALRDTGAASYQLDLRLPMMIDNDYTTKFALSYTRKDLGLALDTAKEVGMFVPITAVIYQLYTLAEKKGLGKLDSAAIYKIYEEWASL
jgi:3-hydroxyisobutyrate dehydrogenase